MICTSVRMRARYIVAPFSIFVIALFHFPPFFSPLFFFFFFFCPSFDESVYIVYALGCRRDVTNLLLLLMAGSTILRICVLMLMFESVAGR